MTDVMPVWATVLVSLLSGGAGVTFVTWLLNRIDRREHTLTREDLDAALADSPTMRDIEAKLDRDYQRLEQSERDRRAIRLDVLRLELFAHTTSRTQHERQLEAGQEYLSLGGNGLGHARHEWLTHDYEQRCKTCDWDYTKTHHE
ncbi:hypothetical protein JS533_001760 [Bifidobacterium amazonense]|uniref:Uncharacterized protein n=1 Tax=Bifidobacterium amazonense TaxID=2809027 RepID=A0ABS9VSQ3_9BIFI|nr:hypothetical protein [Bifidobacterium amazonense]MCH9275015.1 hypothetical protein [Bifidobacterium amazonense]